MKRTSLALSISCLLFPLWVFSQEAKEAQKEMKEEEKTKEQKQAPAVEKKEDKGKTTEPVKEEPKKTEGEEKEGKKKEQSTDKTKKDQKETRFSFRFETSGGMIHREGALGLDEDFGFKHKEFAFSVGVPLFFVLNEGLRDRDYDERHDFGKIVRELSYERKDLGLYLKLAPVTAYNMGNANLLSLYYSTVDRDHCRTGFVGSYNTDVAGGELFFDSFVIPDIAGARLYFRPFWFLKKAQFLRRFEIGASLVSDFTAPSDYKYVAGRKIELESNGLPKVTKDTVMAYSFDTRWALIKSDEVTIAPFFSFSQVEKGYGIEGGLAVEARPAQKHTISLLANFKRLYKSFTSPYFDSLYMVERFDFDGKPKQKAVSDEANSVRMGHGIGAAYAFNKIVSVYALTDLDKIREFSMFRAGTSVKKAPFSFEMTFCERGIEKISSLFDPSRALFVTRFDFRFHKNFKAFAYYGHELFVPKNDAYYKGTDTLLVGLAFLFETE